MIIKTLLGKRSYAQPQDGAVNETKAPGLLKEGKGLFDFCFGHPYATSAFLCLGCLCFGQAHKYLKGASVRNIGTNGQYLSLPALAFLLIALFFLVQLCCVVKAALKKDISTDPTPNLVASASVVVSVLTVRFFGMSVISLYTVGAVIALCLWFRYSKPSHIKGGAFAFVALAAAGGVHYFCKASDTVSEAFVLSAVVISAAVLIVAGFSGGIKTKHVIGIVFLLGFALRLGYVLSVSLERNQHDVFSIYFNLDKRYPRHNSYIWQLYKTGELPTEGVYVPDKLSQYYHPPLHHYTAALWMRFQVVLGIDVYSAYENIQYLTLFYSTAMMVAANKLFEEFKFSGSLRVALFALIALHPTFFIFAGSVNNDPLCVLLMFVAALYSVRWYKNPSYVNTVCLALSIGGAMLAKLSGAMVAFGTAYLMLAKLFDLRTGIINNIKRLWKKFLLFGAICFPLGLWWPLRCLKLFDMPLGYVPSMARSSNNKQFLEGFSVWERISGEGSNSLSNMFPNIGFTDVNGAEGEFYDYGISGYALKSSLFGEYFNKLGVSSFQNILAYIMMFSALLLILYSLVGMVVGLYVSYCNDHNHNIRQNPFLLQGQEQSFRFMLITHAALVASYVLFCFKYPFTCTMDFRYIVPTLLTGAVCAGVLLNGDYKWKKPFRYVYIAATAVFCLAAGLFYLISYNTPII